MYKIGYISGMFDILHIGHIDILKFAKENCDYLIVAVGTDDFVRWRKKHDPVMTYEERKAIVEAIKYVDKVVPCSNLDKIAAYNLYHYDVMIAGSDHEQESVYINATNKLKELGVTTIYYPRNPDVSSTNYKKIIHSKTRL